MLSSVAISEFILLSVSGACATASLLPSTARFAFINIAVAATAGMFRFGIQRPPRWLIRLHFLLTRSVELTGLPFLASGYAVLVSKTLQVKLLCGIAVGAPVIWKIVTSENQRQKIQLFVPAVSFIYIFFVCGSDWQRVYGKLGLAAVSLYLCSTGLMQRQQKIYSIKTVDIFHVCVAIANYLFMYSLFFLYIAVDK